MSSQAKQSRSNGRAKEEEKPKGDPPVFSRRMWSNNGGSIEVAVFPKTVKSDNGEFETFNVSAKRSWKDGDEYKSSQGFRGDDIPLLVSLLQQAHSFICQEMNRK